MDDYSLLGEFPVGFEDVLDAEDLVEADLTVAELRAVDQGIRGAQGWPAGLAGLKEVTRSLGNLAQTMQTLVGDADTTPALREALPGVAVLPSPFRI